MLWKFKNNKNAPETAETICSVYGQGVITDNQVHNWFSKFHFSNMSLRDKPTPGYITDLDQDALRELVECSSHKSSPEIVLISTHPNPQSATTWKRKSEQDGHLGSSYSSWKKN